MRALAQRLVLLCSVVIGGSSLALFAYFLVRGTPVPIETRWSAATRLAWDALLCLAFFAQHSVMVRRGVKERLARIIPTAYHPALYSIASGLVLYAVVLLWQPTNDFLFHLGGAARWVSGAVVVLALLGFLWGVRSLGRFDVFGSVALEAAAPGVAPAPPRFEARGPYGHVRHPLYVCALLLIWSTPRFTTDQLLFDVLWTTWIVIATHLEERDLVTEFGETYRAYQGAVPMLVPRLRVAARPSDLSQRSDSR